MSKDKKKKGGRPKGSTTSEHRILTRIKTQLQNVTVNKVVEALLELALNESGKVPAQTQRGACKDLLQLGVDVEKELIKLKKSDDEEEGSEDEKEGNVPYLRGV